LTVIGLRHCDSGTGVLTTIGDFVEPAVVVVVVADCVDDEHAVRPTTATAARATEAEARRVTAGKPTGGRSDPLPRRKA
jgi:hypothetical protein